MKGEKRRSVRLNQSLWISVIAAAVSIAIGVWILERLPLEGALLIGGAVIFMVFSVVHAEFMSKETEREIMSAGMEQSRMQYNLIYDLPVPFVLTDREGKVITFNREFREKFDKKTGKRNISQMFQELHKKVFPGEGENRVYQIGFDPDIRFRVEAKSIAGDTEGESYIGFYFFDVSALMVYEEDSRKRGLVAGLIYIDNYEEVIEGMEEVRQSLLLAVVERKIVKYMQDLDAIIKGFERDKFLFVMEEQNFQKMKESRFSLLDEVRMINIGNSLSITLSISVGVNEDTYPDTYKSARIAMDLALGRGGDQAVVRNRDDISYYGGKTQKVEKSTRVKARVKAHALRELMLSHERILIMGHKNPDADCVGAALGVYCMAEILEKEAFLVIDHHCPGIEPIISELDKTGMTEKIFVSNEEALALKNGDTMLVVVDVNIPAMTECPELLNRVATTVVLDHHRQSRETIGNAVLSYVEPYASSTCEMVAEVVQYVSEKPKLKPIEADALYAGILVDTDNFVTKAGVRTFEAAAFLRRAGADVTRVRKMFREDFNHVKIVSYIINHAEIFLGEFAIATQYGKGVAGATILGAKAANSLLDIQGIRGSFVLTALEDMVYISARSIDDVNVQVIMEHFQGGGHMMVAAAQVKDKSIPEVVQQLKQLLAKMKEEGDL